MTGRKTNLIKKMGKGAAFASFLVLVMLLSYLATGSACMFKSAVGLPCPGCGMTRACLAALRLDFSRAFVMHPLFPLPVILFPAWVYENYFANKKRLKRFKAFCYISLVLLVSVYVIRMAFLFPHTEPMMINTDSLLWRVIGFIRGV